MVQTSHMGQFRAKVIFYPHQSPHMIFLPPDILPRVISTSITLKFNIPPWICPRLTPCTNFNRNLKLNLCAVTAHICFRPILGPVQFWPKTAQTVLPKILQSRLGAVRVSYPRSLHPKPPSKPAHNFHFCQLKSHFTSFH